VSAIDRIATVSGRLIVVAPAWITASITRHRKSTSLRSASSAENSTSSTCARANRTLSAAASMHWLRVMFSFFSRCRSEVASTICTRGCAAGSSAQKVFSRSRRRHRARAAMVGRRISMAMRRTASASFGEAIGKPASMMSTPSASSARASASFSSTCSEKPGPCSPSRRVVSKIRIWSSISPSGPRGAFPGPRLLAT